MINKEELFKTGNQERIWQKYCGFLDLSLDEFMEIQEQLLTEQIEVVYDSPLCKKFMTRKPKDASEFRRLVPLTTFNDYAAYLNNKNEDVLAVKPYRWVVTSGRGGSPKWVPYTERALEKFGMYGIAVMILACTTRKGEVNIRNGMRVLLNLPAAPYMTGTMMQFLAPRMGASLIPPPDKYENADFETKLQAGFKIALYTGVDVLSSLTSILVKMGERFTESSGQLKLSRQMLHLRLLWRLLFAWLRCKKEGRPMLPKDLWPLRGLTCYGMDTNIYREQLIYYWGREPFESYGATETGLLALNAWNKKSLTFLPASCFLEFIPEEEWLKSRDNKDYQPGIVLLNEVEPGKRYEVVITSFYGMPFLRYRLGDLIKVFALEDKEAGIRLPQVVFDSRADDLIDISGFARLDEKTIWQAIANTGIKYEDWSVRKEYEQNKPVLHLYIELKERIEVKELESLIHQEMANLDPNYRDLEDLAGIRPLRVTTLSEGSFKRYYQEKRKAGADLAHLKPPHMNAPDAAIRELLKHE